MEVFAQKQAATAQKSSPDAPQLLAAPSLAELESSPLLGVRRQARPGAPRPLGNPPAGAGSGLGGPRGAGLLGHDFNRIALHGGVPALQAKLSVNAPGDMYEQEADAMAERVMRMAAPKPVVAATDGAAPSVQRKCAACGAKVDDDHDGGLPSIQRKCAACAAKEDGDEEGTIHAKEVPGNTPQVTPSVQGRIDSLRGGGAPMAPGLREFFEPRFAYDFSNVRLHTSAGAAESARGINALAYTTGRDIVFAPGMYSPGTTAGMRLLAHELTHVVQQGGGGLAAARQVHRKAPGDMIQRDSDVRQLPGGLPCVTVSGPGHPAGGTTVQFTTGTTLDPAGVTSIGTFQTSWTAAGGTDDVSIDGFASTGGTQAVNWRIACDRAQEVKTRLVALGIPDTKITTFAHGESTEFAPAATTPNRVAIIHSGNRLAASDTTVDRVERLGATDSLFFDRGSAVLSGTQAGKIAALATPAGQNLTLFGFVSEDETGGAALATARIAAVDALFAAPPNNHIGTRTPNTTDAVTSGQGQIDYRSMRKVVVRPSGGGSGVPQCSGGSLIGCAPANVFTDAQTRADALLAPAITALAAPNAATKALIDRHFHTTAATRPGVIAAVLANFRNLQPHISTQMTPVSTLGPGPGFVASPGHRCANSCDGLCGSGATAYNSGQNATAVMTLCDTPRGFMQEPDVNERAATLIHEGLHGITLRVGAPGTNIAGTNDFSYMEQRLIKFLDPATALQNTDTYVAFVRELNGHVITVGRAVPDTATGVVMTPAERLQVDRAIAWLEGWAVWASLETGSLYDTIDKSITAGSWTNTYYRRTMELIAPRFGLTMPPAVPVNSDKLAVAAISERYTRMSNALYSTATLTIDRVAAGATSWSAGPGFNVTIGPDFFSIPAGSRHDRAQLDLLSRALVTATTGVSADAVTRYMDGMDQIRIHQGGGTP